MLIINSLGSIAPFGVNILRTFRVHSAVWRHSKTYGYAPVQALRSRASISRTATQTTLYTMLEVRGHRDSPYIPVVALKTNTSSCVRKRVGVARVYVQVRILLRTLYAYSRTMDQLWTLCAWMVVRMSWEWKR